MKPNRLVFALLCLTSAASFGQQPANAPYLDPSLPSERRAADLVSRMTLEEKVLQMQSTAPAIPRLGVPAYNWWNEALHGVAQGRATVFPQAIGLAATWDTDLMHRVADIISTEARAKYNDAADASRPFRSGRARDPSRPHRRTDVLVAERQHLPGSPLGTRPGDLRRGSLSDRPHGRRVRHRDAGRRPPLPEGGLHAQALRRAQRPGAGATRLRRQGERVRPRPHVPGGVPDGGRRGQGRLDHVRLQRRERDARLRQR